MGVSTTMSPLTAPITMETKHHPVSPSYATLPYRLSPQAHSSPSPTDHHSTPSPHHESRGLHVPQWISSIQQDKKDSREVTASDQEGPLNLSKPRSEVIKRERSEDLPGFSMRPSKRDRDTPPPPAHSNHHLSHRSANSNLNSPPMSHTPPKVSIPDSTLLPSVRPPFLPPHYANPFLGLAGQFPVSVLNNMTNNFTTHSAFLMNGGKLPGMDSSKVW